MKPPKINSIVLITFFLFIFSASLCFGAQNDGPEETVVKYYCAYKKGEWDEAAKYLHPDSLTTFQEKIIEIIKKTEKKSQLEFINHYKVNTIDELSKLSPKEFFIRHQEQTWGDSDPRVLKIMKHTKIEILNTELRNNNEYLVKFRTSLESGQFPDKTATYLVTQYKKTWKINFAGR